MAVKERLPRSLLLLVAILLQTRAEDDIRAGTSLPESMQQVEAASQEPSEPPLIQGEDSPDLRPAEAACDPMSAETRTRISQIRHAAAVIAGFADGTMAQLPVASNVVVPCIQAAMIYAIAQQYGCYLDRASAMAIATMLSSDYVKTALVGHAAGWIPIAGNLLKTGLSVLMTEGMGSAAEQMLGCPTARLELLEKVQEQDNPADEKKEAYHLREHFHAIVDFLCNASLSGTTEAAREVWKRVESLFRQEDQVALLAKVHEARSPKDLLELVMKYKWNLKVVEASLEALRDRFPRQLACTDVDAVAKGFWATKAADGEVKAVVAPHLLHCWSSLPVDLRVDASSVAQDLVIEAVRAGSAAPGALAVLLAAFRSGITLEVPSVALLDGLMKAVRLEADACNVLREMFRQEALADIIGSWVQVQHVQYLDHMEAPPAGSEICLPGLMHDVKMRLTLPNLPSGAELPGTEKPKATKALDQALSGLVGQNCAVKRLMQSPGYVRVRKKGMHRPEVPLVLLLTGPSGTGKTMAARKIAEYIHERPFQELVRTGRFKLFPMNQFSTEEDLKTFFGPPRGIQGTGDLPDLVRPNPDAVIVLDEIEKAHRSFAKSFLTVFGEHGAVYDPRTGRDYPASNITFVLTSNLAKDLLIRHPAAVAKTMGRSLESNHLLPKGADVDPDCVAYAELRELVEREIGQAKDNAFFRESEIRGRLTDTLPFLPFGPYEVQEAVRGFLTSEAEAFIKSPNFANLELTWMEDVVTSFANLYVRKPDEGLRAVNKQLQSQVRDLLGRAMDVEGLVPRHARVVLRMANDRALDLRVVPQEPRTMLQSLQSASDVAPSPSSEGKEAPATFFSVVSDAFANLTGPADSGPSPSTGSGSTDWEWQYDWEWQSDWDWLYTWDWQQLWEHILLFLWKWRFPLALTFVCLFAALTAGSAAPAVAPVAAVATGAGATGGATVLATGAATATTVGTTAAAVTAWAFALIQVLGSSVSVAVPGLTFFYAWQYKHYIEAVIFCSVSLALCPWAVRVYRTTYKLLQMLHSTKGTPKPLRPKKVSPPLVEKRQRSLSGGSEATSIRADNRMDGQGQAHQVKEPPEDATELALVAPEPETQSSGSPIELTEALSSCPTGPTADADGAGEASPSMSKNDDDDEREAMQ